MYFVFLLEVLGRLGRKLLTALKLIQWPLDQCQTKEMGESNEMLSLLLRGSINRSHKVATMFDV
jgi:hypothetical protein